MPTRLSVQRTSSRLSVSYDRASLRNVKITVGKKMTIGMKDELRVYLKGDARPLRYRSLLEGSMNEEGPRFSLSDPNFLKSTEILTSARDGIPAPESATSSNMTLSCLRPMFLLNICGAPGIPTTTRFWERS